jgi:phosphomevalonate kinase
MAADVPSPAALESQCLHCHHDDRLDRAHVARRQLEDVKRLRTTLSRAKREIAAIREPDRRTSLTARWTDADVSIRAVVAGIHAFDLGSVQERLRDSNGQTERLVADLARR